MNKRSVGAALATIAVAATILTGCAQSSNTTACKLYEDAYNQMADSVKMEKAGTLTQDDVRGEVDQLPARIGDAFQKASGDVAVKIRDSRSLAAGMVADSSNQDVGVAFFMSADSVATACGADGASISLHKTH